MRILFITQWFQPEPQLTGMPFAKALVKLGHEVQVLTGFPNYPGGKLYDGYKIKLLQKETIEGISVLRVPLYPSHDNSAFRRFLNYASFALSAAILGPWVVSRADVIYAYHPPATIFFPVWLVHFLRRIPIVYNIQNLWPDTLRVTGMFKSNIGLKLVNSFCNLTYKMSDKIVVLSPGFKNVLCARGVSADKIEVVYNWCDDEIIHSAAPKAEFKQKMEADTHFNIMFAGNIGKAQLLDPVLEAAQRVKKRYPHVQFIFVGGGIDVDRLNKKSHELNLDNVKFFPYQPQSEIASILSIADVLLVHLKDDPLFRITIPSKIQAYMSVGKAIIVGVNGDATDLVIKAKAGVSCQSGNSDSIFDAISKLVEMPKSELAAMGMNGREFYNKELALDVGAKKYEEIFMSVIRKNKTR